MREAVKLAKSQNMLGLVLDCRLLVSQRLDLISSTLLTLPTVGGCTAPDSKRQRCRIALDCIRQT